MNTIVTNATKQAGEMGTIPISPNHKTINIGLLGCGNVGTGFVKLLNRHKKLIHNKTGVEVKISRILVKQKEKRREVPKKLLTFDPRDIIDDENIDLVVELIGGTEEAGRFILRAIKSGKHVVTANKALLAKDGKKIIALADRKGVKVGFEASVCAGVPIIQAISEGLVADKIDFFAGIVNGTCNYILSRMADTSCTFKAALKEAQEKGFSEPDPTLDITGTDAAQKLTILSSLSFGAQVELNDIYREGIEHIEDVDIRLAKRFGYRVKHLIIGKNHPKKGLELRAHPVFLNKSHPLANINGEFNAVLVAGEAVGELIFTGKGAGPSPTATAVLSDVIELAREYRLESYNNSLNFKWGSNKLIDIGETESEYYIRIPIYDRPGAIGAISSQLGERGVSIKRAEAELIPSRKNAGNVYILAHRCKEKHVKEAIKNIRKLRFIREKPVVIRIGY